MVQMRQILHMQEVPFQFLSNVFSSFFIFLKKLPIVVVRSVCPSVCPSVRPSVEIISFRGNSLSNWLIELKIGLNVREGVVHVRKA